MTEDFQRIFDDNQALKKNLLLARHQIDKLQQENSDLKFDYQELLNKNTELNHIYGQLQKKSQLQLAQHSKVVGTLTMQIEELKILIEQKQVQLQNFQIKIIPNLDQDMIRVKLITEMEGPYQQAVQKKEKEIVRLKEKLTESQRKSSISELQLSTKSKEFKRELEETKAFYQSENEKLLKELNIALNKKEIKAYDKQLFKSQRKQLEQLRLTLNLHQQNQMELRKQLASAKSEKEKLLVQISVMNEKKALELHLSSENTELRVLRQEKKRMEDDLARKGEELDRLQKKMRNLQKQYKSNEEELKRTLNRTRQELQHEKQLLMEELRREKEENRKARDIDERKEDDWSRLNQNLRAVEKQLLLKKKECQQLKEAAAELQKKVRELQLSKKRKLSLTKDIIENVMKENTDQQINKGKSQLYIKELEKVNAKLKDKLQLANKKIVELLKQKAKNAEINSSFSRERAFSNIEIDRTKPTKDILLEFRDTSLTPLVPPTLYTRQTKI